MASSLLYPVSFSALRLNSEIRQWVVRWSKHLELGWGQHDVDLVTDFLNRRYYHFTTEN